MEPDVQRGKARGARYRYQPARLFFLAHHQRALESHTGVVHLPTWPDEKSVNRAALANLFKSGYKERNRSIFETPHTN